MTDHIKTLRDGLERLARLGNGDYYGTSDGNVLAQQLLPALDALEEAMREPVAWGLERSSIDGAIIDCITPEEHDRMEGGYTIPLYAAPPAQQTQPTDVAQCAECGKKASEGWFLYCVSCADKALGSEHQGEPVATVQQRAEGGVEAHLHHFLPIGTKLYAQQAQAEAVPQWQPIETAPKNGTDFVAAYALQGFVKRIVRWSTVHGQWQSHGEWLPGFASNATHWMPLPAAPQPKGEQT